MKILLHIGLPKTGTTFLQQQIWHHRQRLSNHGIHVPFAGTLGWVRLVTGLEVKGRASDVHSHLLFAWSVQLKRDFAEPIARALPKVWESLREELSSCGRGHCLISAENLSSDLRTSAQINALRDRLGNADVEIICCERTGSDFVASLYGELISLGRVSYSLDDCIDEFRHLLEPAVLREMWRGSFSNAPYTAVHYEAIAGEDILQKILAAALPGHPSGRDVFTLMPGTDRYRSMSPRFLRVIEELAVNGIRADPILEYWSGLPSRYRPLERRLVSPEEVAAAMQRHGIPWNEPVTQAIAGVGRLEELLVERTRRLREGAAALADLTADLVRTRASLVERTTQLEETLTERATERDALKECIRDLVETRSTLVARTALLEQRNQELAARTRELVETRAQLAARAASPERHPQDLAGGVQEPAELPEATAERAALQRQQDQELAARTRERDETRTHLAERTAVLEQRDKELVERTQELVETRATLADRTARLEQRLKDLAERTRDLEETRNTLVERTALLEQREQDLAAQTREVLEMRAALAERTISIEQRDTELTDRTRELREERTALAERTAFLEQLGKDLVERTQELVQNRDLLAERTASLEQLEKELAARTGELVETRSTLVARTALLEERDKDLANRTHELAEMRATLAEDAAVRELKDMALAERTARVEALTTELGKFKKASVLHRVFRRRK